jgi:hypothetical protein
MVRKPTSIDEYLATVSGQKRVALDELRKAIRTVVPKAEECISYGMPAFRLDGKVVGGFAATAKGCANGDVRTFHVFVVLSLERRILLHVRDVAFSRGLGCATEATRGSRPRRRSELLRRRQPSANS